MSLEDELNSERLEEIKTGTAEASRRRAESAVIRQLTDELRHVQKLLGLYEQGMSAPISPPEWRVRPQHTAEHAGIVMACLSDTHFDEVIRPEQVLMLNCYNRPIAEMRFQSWAEKVAELPRKYTRGVEIEGLVVPALGDVFSGEIHEELKLTNEAGILESILYWIERTISVAELLDREFRGNVEFDCVVGNHGRDTQKPIYKNRPQNNFEWLFWSVVRDRLRDRKSRVTINVSPAMSMIVPVYGRNHRLEHGDEFKGGTGISAALAPLMLGQHRTSVQQIAIGEPMETMVIGHWHQVLDLPGLICAGALKGYDEYAFGKKYRPEEAQQMLWITTPERGKTVTMPVFLQDREAEGW
jgi:hypothetical protein